MALAQSHENLAAAAVQFEESQERSNQLLGGLRGWLDRFTGTARPEDINPIAAMLPEPGIEDEVVALMTDCQDAALMLEHSTNRHTEQLRDIFRQAGKIYGSEIEKVQKKGSAASGAAREKIASLQEHASKVEDLLKSMQEERANLHHKFAGAEQRCRWLEERYREDKTKLQEGVSKYRHQVMQLQHVVAGYEDKARRQEQIEREPRLAPLLDKLKAPVSGADAEQLRHLQAETTRLASENAALTEMNKKLYRDLVVSRLADQGGKRSGGRGASTVAPVDWEASSEANTTSAANDSASTALAEETLRNARDKIAAAEKALLESKGLRGAIRDLRRQSSGQLSGEVEARRKAVSELEAALKQAKAKEVAAAEANAELLTLRSELAKTQDEVQALHEAAAEAKRRSDAISANSTAPPKPLPLPATDDPPSPAAPEPKPASPPPQADFQKEASVLSPVDYDGLVSRAISQEEEGLSELRRKAGDVGVAQRHCDKADKVFSDVVDCCGEGMSSVERILTGTQNIEDDDGTEKVAQSVAASSIQESLATALERAIASASVLLREALVGRIRACEAEKQVSLEQEAAEEAHARVEVLSQEKTSLADEVQKHLTQARAMREEIAALRKDMGDAKEQTHCGKNNEEEDRQAQIRQVQAEEHEGDAPVQVEQPPQEPPPSLLEAVDDSATWRRRYEHLAGLLAEQTKRSGDKAIPLTTPIKTRSSPRSARPKIKYSSSGGSTTSQRELHAPGITETSVSSIGVQGDAAPTTTPRGAVDGSSNTTPRPPPSLLATKVSHQDTKGEGKPEQPDPVALVSTGVSAADAPPSYTKREGQATQPDHVALVSTGVSASDAPCSIDNRGGEPSVVSTRKLSKDSETQEGSAPMLVEASDGGPPATQDGDGVVIPSDAIVATGDEGDPRLQKGSDSSNVRLHNSDQAAKQLVSSVEPTTSPSIDMAAAENTTAMTSAAVPTETNLNDTTQGQVGREDGNVAGHQEALDNDATAEEAREDASNIATEVERNRENGGEREGRLSVSYSCDTRVVAKEADDSTLVGWEEHQDASSMNAKEGNEQRDMEEELEQQLEERRDEDGDYGGNKRSSAETGWSGSLDVNPTSTIAAVERTHTRVGRERYESLDGEALLGKLLDDRVSSAMFEDDHRKLLQKVMRVRDNEHARHEATARYPSSASGSPLSATCEECPALREDLAARSADVEAAKEQQRAAQEELEASEHRVHVMTADIASLQTKLAEQADVMRHGRALADKIIAAPSSMFPQVRAAQDFKELTDKVANTRGESRGKRSARGQAAAAAARGRRVGGGGRSKSPPPPSSRGGGRSRNSAVLPAGSSGGRRERQTSESNSSTDSSSQSRRVSRKGSGKSSISTTTTNNNNNNNNNNNKNKRSTKGEVVKSACVEGGGNVSRAQTCQAGATSETSPTQTSNELAAEAGPDIGQSDQQEESPREGKTPEDAEMVDVAVDSGVVDNQQHDTATNIGRAADNDVVEVDSRQDEAAANIGEAPEDDAVEAALVIESNQQEDVEEVKSSRAEGAPSTSIAAATEVNTLVASLPPQKDTSRTTSQDEVSKDLDATSSVRTQGVSGQNQRGQSQPNQPSGSTPVALETTRTPAPLPLATEEQSQDRETTEENNTLSSLVPKTSSEGNREEMDPLDDTGEGDDGQDCALGPETNEAKQLVSTAFTEFVPAERSLAAYCQATARCRLAIEAFETTSESSFGSISLNDGSRETDETYQRLMERYSMLKDTMMDWGVEAAQALLVEVTKTAAKHRTISAWTTVVMGHGGDNGKKRGGATCGASARSLESMHARQDRATLLMTEKTVLEEVVQAFGGWEAAVFLDSGVVNLDVDVATWPIEDQVAILAALNDHLRDELEDNGTRHDQALRDILGRLQDAQGELEHLRSYQKELESGLESPEATTPEGSTTEKVVPGVVLNPLPESEEEDTPPSENETDACDSDLKDGLSEGEGKREEEDDHDEQEASSAVVSTTPGPAQDDAVEEAINETNRQLQTQLTMSIAALRRTKEELRKEKERSERTENQLRQYQLQKPNTPEEKIRSLEQAPPLLTATPTPAASILAAPGPSPGPGALPPQLQAAHQPPPPEAKYQPPPRAASKNKFDLIAQADIAQRQAQEKEAARLRAGYPLAALAMERRAVADLRAALVKTVCAILELCQYQQHQPDPQTETTDGEGSPMMGGQSMGNASADCDPRTHSTRGPPSTLVQMVCSGDDANVRCATSEYMLSTGTAASRCSTAVGYGSSVLGGKASQDRRNISNASTESKVAASGRGLQPSPSSSGEEAKPGSHRSKFREISKTVAESGTMARTILSGWVAAGTPESGTTQGSGPGRKAALSTNVPSPKTVPPPTNPREAPSVNRATHAEPVIVPPPTNPREALSIARATSAEVRSFLDEIEVDVGAEGGTPAGQTPPFGIPGDDGYDASWRAQATAPKRGVPTDDNAGGADEVDTTASTRVANALHGDILWAESLPTFVRKAMEAQEGGYGQQVALKEREIVILTEAQQELRRDLRTFKADYVSADAEDVIRALRKRQRGLNNQVRHLERQLELAHQSSEVQGGAIEVLEGILVKRDIDKQLCHSLGLKSLEIGLKIRMLETDAGGKTVEVSRLSRKEQRAVTHLKGRLVKERRITDARKETVAAELERSLLHGMRAFERVSRTIQRLCNGYTSLPGLLEWGRITAARLESTTAAGSRCGLHGDSVTSANSIRGNLHASCGSGGVGVAGNNGGLTSFTREATTAAPTTGGTENHDRLIDGLQGPGGQQPGSALGADSVGNDRTSSSTYTSGHRLRSTEHRHGGGVWASSVSTAPYYFSGSGLATTASLPGRVSTTIDPSLDTLAAQEKSYYLPKKSMVARGQHRGGGCLGDGRKGAWVAGHTNVGGTSTRGVLCAAEYGGGGSDLSSLGSSRSGYGEGVDGGSSVASLLREDRAFKRRSGALHG
eukprot:g2825.t1